MPKQSQCWQLVEYFRAGGSLTVAESLHKFGIYALSQRCGEVNAHPNIYGIEIESETVCVNGKHFSRYREKVKAELFQ